MRLLDLFLLIEDCMVNRLDLVRDLHSWHFLMPFFLWMCHHCGPFFSSSCWFFLELTVSLAPWKQPLVQSWSWRFSPIWEKSCWLFLLQWFCSCLVWPWCLVLVSTSSRCSMIILLQSRCWLSPYSSALEWHGFMAMTGIV